MDVSHKRELYSGFGNSLGQAFELAMIPVVFGAIGWFVDGWLGVRPLFTAVLVVIALVGLATKVYYRYEADMAEHDAAGPWGRR